MIQRRPSRTGMIPRSSMSRPPGDRCSVGAQSPAALLWHRWLAVFDGVPRGQPSFDGTRKNARHDACDVADSLRRQWSWCFLLAGVATALEQAAPFPAEMQRRYLGERHRQQFWIEAGQLLPITPHRLGRQFLLRMLAKELLE